MNNTIYGAAIENNTNSLRPFRYKRHIKLINFISYDEPFKLYDAVMLTNIFMSHKPKYSIASVSDLSEYKNIKKLFNSIRVFRKNASVTLKEPKKELRF